MAEPDRPRSPFAGMVDLSARTPVRVLSFGEIERLLAEHRLYLETEYHQGHRANFSSADLAGRDFSGLNLLLQEARLNRADLSGARLSGANLVSANLESACLAKADMEFALMANAMLRGACLREADMSGAQLDAAVLTRADLRKANLRGAGFRDALLDAADLSNARLGSAFLVGTSLHGADLRGAYLRLAKLDGADLSDANLGGAEGLMQAQLDRAHCSSGTKLPEGLTGVEDARRWRLEINPVSQRVPPATHSTLRRRGRASLHAHEEGESWPSREKYANSLGISPDDADGEYIKS